MTQLLQLPPDTLSLILAYTPDTITLSILQLCGNKELTQLVGRSVREIMCNVDNGMTWAAKNILLLPRLTSFMLKVKAASFKTLLTLVSCLPSTLLKLRFETYMGRSVFVRRITARDADHPMRKHFQHEDYMVESLDERFPLLEYCHLPDGSLQFEWPAEVKFYFVQHLPRSLTYLHLQSLADLPPIVWNYLPPNLVTLNSKIYLLPSVVAFPPSLFQSLQSLTLDIHAAQVYHYYRENPLPGVKLDENGAPQSTMIKLPPNLTSLSTTLSGLPPPGNCPTYLAYLHIQSTRAKIPLPKLLSSLPPSLYSLSLHRLELTLDEASMKDMSKSSHATVRVLRLEQVAFSSPIALLQLLKSLPNLETYECTEPIGIQSEMLPSILEAFNPNTLTRLRAPFPYIAFSTPGKETSFTLASVLPNLQTLDVMEPGNGSAEVARQVSLHGLPTSLHSLSFHITRHFINDNILIDLPPHLTHLKIPRLSFTGAVPELDPCVFFSSRAPSNRASADTFDLTEAVVLTLSNGKNQPRITLTRALDSTPPSEITILQLHNPKMRLPSTLKAIKVAATSPAPPSFALAANLYPNLTKLWLLEMPNRSIQLELLVSLRSLTLLNFKTAPGGRTRLPPALLTFKTHSLVSLTSGFAFLLPTTLTKLKALDISPPHFLTSLPHLTSLSISKSTEADSELQGTLVKLPTGAMTRLELRMKLTIPIINKFALLQVWIQPYVSDTIIRYVETRNTPGAVQLRLERATLYKVDGPKRLAARLGTTESHLDQMIDGSIVDGFGALTRALERAYPFLVKVAVSL